MLLNILIFSNNYTKKGGLEAKMSTILQQQSNPDAKISKWLHLMLPPVALTKTQKGIYNLCYLAAGRAVLGKTDQRSCVSPKVAAA